MGQQPIQCADYTNRYKNKDETSGSTPDYADSQGKIQVPMIMPERERNNVSKQRKSTECEGRRDRPREGRESNKYKEGEKNIFPSFIFVII